MSTDIKLFYQSSGFLGKMFGNLDKKALLDLIVCLAKEFLPKLATKANTF